MSKKRIQFIIITLLLIAGISFSYSKYTSYLKALEEKAAYEEMQARDEASDRTLTTDMYKLPVFINVVSEELTKSPDTGICALIGFDGDHMTQMCDTYGEENTISHYTQIGEIVKRHFPEGKNNILCNKRTGSDNFYIFAMHRNSMEDIIKEVESLQAEIGSHISYIYTLELNSTVSAGICQYQGEDIETLVDNVNHAIEESKDKGEGLYSIFSK